MKKVMLLAAMLAMVLAASVPAFAQSVNAGDQNARGGAGADLIQQCQNNLAQENVQAAVGGAGTAVGGVSGDVNAEGGAATNVNTIQQNCVNIANSFNEVVGGDTVVNIDRDVINVVGFTTFEGVEQTVFFDVTQNVFFIVVNQEIIIIDQDIVVFTVEGEVVSPDVAVVSPDVAVTETTTVLPETGGASLLALGGGALLVAGGLLARRIVR
ncbi:hypothetical protein BH24ACT18_BH24ACT18_02650 [soil metagenome]